MPPAEAPKLPSSAAAQAKLAPIKGRGRPISDPTFLKNSNTRKQTNRDEKVEDSERIATEDGSQFRQEPIDFEEVSAEDQ